LVKKQESLIGLNFNLTVQGLGDKILGCVTNKHISAGYIVYLVRRRYSVVAERIAGRPKNDWH
jgi:hypothetical protein